MVVTAAEARNRRCLIRLLCLCSVDARDTFGSELYDDCHELLDLTNDPDTIFHDLNWSSTVPDS